VHQVYRDYALPNRRGDPCYPDWVEQKEQSKETKVSAELRQNTSYILAQAEAKMYGDADPQLSAFRVTFGPKPEPQALVFVEHPGQYSLVNPQVDLLKRLYATYPPEIQAQFPRVLIAQLSKENARVVAQALVELRYVSALREWTRIDDVGVALWEGIEEKLRYEHWTFSQDDIQHIASGMGGIYTASVEKMAAPADPLSGGYRQGLAVQNFLKRLRAVYKRVQYIRLKDELLNVQNPALDTDRRELLTRLEVLGFSKKLSEALDEMDRRRSGAATSVDFKTAMELLRTFFEEFIEEAAQKVSENSSVIFPTGEKCHFSTYKDYLRNSAIIGREEEELLQKIYNYLSNMGSHVLGSTPEQFHVSRMTVVEWCMMIAGRVQSYLSAPPRP
jgi:hypothetical protein